MPPTRRPEPESERRGAPAPSPELPAPGCPVGRWRSQGHIVDDPPVPITGTDSDDGARWQPWMDMTFTRMP